MNKHYPLVLILLVFFIFPTIVLADHCNQFISEVNCLTSPAHCAWNSITRSCGSSTPGSQTNITDSGASSGPQPGQNVVRLQNPLGEGKERTDLRAIIGEVIKKVLTVLGSITLLVFIAGGVMWLTSGGSEEKVAKGSKTMLYAVIGIAVIFAAYAILNTVIRTLTGTGG